MEWETFALAGALGMALALRPWRLLARHALHTPLLAVLVIWPWLWAMPRMPGMPLPLQWSGACLVQLCLGWPLAVPVLCMVALLSCLWVPAPIDTLLAQAWWQGVLPATLAMAWGAALRRWVRAQIFVYTLGRCFFGTVLSLFVARLLAQWTGQGLPESSDAAIAHWLVAWGEGVLTGLICAVAVAYAPERLLTWSDRRYLQRP